MSLPLGHPQVWGRLFYCVCSHNTVYSSLKVLFIPQLIVSLLFSPLISCEDRYCPFFWVLWHPTPVLLPGKSRGRRSLVGCSPWGREESDTTERLKWQTTSAFLPGESQGPRSLVGCCLWGHRVRHDWSDLAAAAATVSFEEHMFLILTKFSLSTCSFIDDSLHVISEKSA